MTVNLEHTVNITGEDTVKPIDAIRLQLTAMELVEGTELDWWEVMRSRSWRFVFRGPPKFTDKLEDYELAIGIIEGKPVWEDDKYYDRHGFECIAAKYWRFTDTYWATCTWLPPATKTAPVYLLVEDMQEFAKHCRSCYPHIRRIQEACRKTLEGMK